MQWHNISQQIPDIRYIVYVHVYCSYNGIISSNKYQIYCIYIYTCILFKQWHNTIQQIPAKVYCIC